MKKMISPLLCAWVAMAERHARFVLVLLAILAAGATMYALENFSIDSDLDKLIKPSPENQWHKYNQDFVHAFPDYQKNAVVVVSGASAKQTFMDADKVYQALQKSGRFDDVFAPVFDPFFTDHALYSLSTEAVKRLSDEVEKSIPDLSVVYHKPSLANMLAYLQKQYQTAEQMEILLPETAYQLEAFNQSVSRLAEGRQTDFHLVQRLAPPQTDGTHYQLITVKRKPSFSEKLPNKAMMEDIDAIIKAVDISDGVDVRVTGEIAMMHQEISAGVSGVEFAGMLSLVLLAIILGFGVRSKVVISGIFIMLFIGVMCSIVFTLMTFQQFNTLSLVFVVMFFGLGVDFAVHYSLRILELMQHHDRHSAVVKATSDAGVALGICTVTSALAFLSFLPTDYIGLAELGVISAFGMLFAYFLSLTFIPAWFKVWRLQAPPAGVARISYPPSMTPPFPARSILVLGALLAALSAWYVKDMSFNYNLLSMRDQESEPVQTLKELQDNGVVTNYGISALVESRERIAELKTQLMALPTVAEVEAPVDHIPMFQSFKQQHMQAVREKLDALGEPGQLPPLNKVETGKALESFISNIENGYQNAFVDSDLAAVEDLLASLRYLQQHEKLWPRLQMDVAEGIADDVNRLQTWFSAMPYTLDDLPEYIHRRFVSADGHYLVHIKPAVDMSYSQQSTKFIEEVKSVFPRAAGMVVHEWGVGKIVVDSFRQAAMLSTSFIFVVLFLTFRRLSTVMLVFVPLVLVTLFTMAIAKSFGIRMNMANVLVVPLIFGLGVDACIHVVHRYHLSDSLRELLYSSTTKAVLISALTTIGAFVSIAFSPHYGAASIGLLLAIALSLLLLITFLVLPALLLVFEPKKAAPGGSL